MATLCTGSDGFSAAVPQEVYDLDPERQGYLLLHNNYFDSDPFFTLDLDHNGTGSFSLPFSGSPEKVYLRFTAAEQTE